MGKKTKNPETDFIPKPVKELDKECQKNIKDFDELLNTLSSLDDKRKALWKQIYQNSVIDRRNAYIMFSDLYQKVHGHHEQHAIHGVNLTKYLERLNKSNEQLIKLAELVNNAIDEEDDGDVNEEEIYKKLGDINTRKKTRTNR